MVGRKTIKDYNKNVSNFNALFTIYDYFDIVIANKCVGNNKLAKKQSLKLSKKQRVRLMKHADYYLAKDETKEFFRNLFILGE